MCLLLRLESSISLEVRSRILVPRPVYTVLLLLSFSFHCCPSTLGPRAKHGFASVALLSMVDQGRRVCKGDGGSDLHSPVLHVNIDLVSLADESASMSLVMGLFAFGWVSANCAPFLLILITNPYVSGKGHSHQPPTNQDSCHYWDTAYETDQSKMLQNQFVLLSAENQSRWPLLWLTNFVLAYIDACVTVAN